MSSKNDEKEKYKYVALYEDGTGIIIRAYNITDAKVFANAFAIGLDAVWPLRGILPNHKIHDITNK